MALSFEQHDRLATLTAQQMRDYYEIALTSRFHIALSAFDLESALAVIATREELDNGDPDAAITWAQHIAPIEETEETGAVEIPGFLKRHDQK